MGSISPKLIRPARHYSGLSTVDLRSAAMATVAGSSYGLIHLMNMRMGTRGRGRILPSSGLTRRCFGGDDPRAGRRCSTETTRSGSVKPSVSSVALQMDSRCGEEAPGAVDRAKVDGGGRIARRGVRGEEQSNGGLGVVLGGCSRWKRSRGMVAGGAHEGVRDGSSVCALCLRKGWRR